MLQEYKKLVDKTKAFLIETGVNDLQKMYQVLDLKGSGGFSRSVITDQLYSNIKNSLNRGSENLDLGEFSINELLEGLVYESVLYDFDNSNYISITEVIRDASARSAVKMSIENWTNAIQNAKDYIHLNGSLNNLENLRKDYPKYYDTAIAAKKLKEIGCEIVLENAVIKVNNGLENIVQEIEKAIELIGGITVMKVIFFHLVEHNLYKKELDRYLVVQQFNIDPSHTQPVIPFGYILNLAAKYPFENKEYQIQKKIKEKINFILQRSSLILSGFGIQRYHQLESAFISSEGIPEFIRNTALFDSVFTFPQGNPNVEILYLRNLFKWIDVDIFKTAYIFTVENYIIVAQTIMEECKKIFGPKIIYLSTLYKKLKNNLSEEKLSLILDTLSHKQESVNKGFHFFHQQDEVNFNQLPLIKMGKTKYLLCELRWSCPSFYECLANLARQLYPKNCDEKVGEALEAFLYQVFTEKNISYKEGEYVNCEKGECDMLIEEEETIVLIEIKKKVLTRKARSGVDTRVIIDLTDSLLKAQYQAGRTELILRQKGYIELKDKNGTLHKIELKGREIERIALSHLDYYSFQDRVFIKRLLTLLVDTRLNLLSNDDSFVNKKFSELTNTSDLLKEQYINLEKIDAKFKEHPYFNCWFLSVTQLLLILEYSNDAKSFVQSLRKAKHVTFSTSNFYYEYYEASIKSTKQKCLI